MNALLDIVPGIVGLAGVAGGVFAALRSKWVRRTLAQVLDSDAGLQDRIQLTVHSAVSALESALQARGAELTRLETELGVLRAEVASLRSADQNKTLRIQELEREVEELREENATLRAEIARRRGGRPKKETA